jgi:[ribosomal protein S18]-alanine N-acetyltransferase
MAADLVLRRLGALDLDRAAAVHGESFAPLGERAWTRQDLAGLLASPGVTGLLLQAEGRDAGIALCRVAADEAELLTIAVRPTERRRGAGRRLLTAVIDHAREAGAGALFLEVGADNPPARALYEAMGFRAIGTRTSYYRRGDGPLVDALVMRLSLN